MCIEVDCFSSFYFVPFVEAVNHKVVLIIGGYICLLVSAPWLNNGDLIYFVSC